MKKLYALSLFFSLIFSISAHQRSPQEALARLINVSTRAASSFLINDDTPVFSLKKDGFTSLYIFNTGSKGYVIVSADDCTVPLLGYSDSENFDARNMPSQLKWWLDFYAGEIQYAADHGLKAEMLSTRSDFSPISPMLKTQWNQDAPYNDDCPLDNGKRSVTGCVATAMAQAMKYFNWPAKGTGENSYSWNNQTISLNFANISFDWNNMADTYNSSSSGTQNAAVAQLMYACGVAVNMDYSSSESGANSFAIGPALYNYFGYSDEIVMPSRAFYGTSDWQNLIYQQLANGMPVIYGGDSDSGGHQFVCDGYNADGYFHFNWGWSGQSDGYYLLSALDPISQGIGGSTTGYNYNQGIIVNMIPIGKSGTVDLPKVYCYGNFATASSSASLSGKAQFKSDGGFYNFGVKEIVVNFGVKVTDSNGNSQYISESESVALRSLYGIDSVDVELPTNLAEGSYTVTPVYKESGSSSWTDIPTLLSGIRSLSMKVANSTAYFTDNNPEVEISDFKIDSNLYIGSNFKASFTIKNTGSSEFYSQLMIGLINQYTNEEAGTTSSAIAVDLESGQSSSIDFISEFVSSSSSSGESSSLSPGTYNLVVFDMETGNIFYEYPQSITLQAAPSDTKLSITNFGLEDGSSVVTDVNAIKFNGTVECEQGYYANQLIVAIFAEGATTTTNYASSDFLFLNTGQSADFSVTISMPNAKSGEEYEAVVYTASTEQLSNPLLFSIGDSDTGINEIFNSDQEIHFYKLDGLEVSSHNLTPGMYIVKKGNHTSKIIINR